MTTRSTRDGAQPGTSIGQLVASIKDDLTGLVRDEIALAKAELREDAKAAALGGGFVAVAAALAVFALMLLSFALVYGVSALGVGLGWSFLIVGGAYLLLAALLVLLAKGRFGRVTGIERTKTTAREAARALRPSAGDAART